MDRSGAGTGALNNQRQRRDPLAIACSLLLAGIAVLCLVEVTLRYGFGGGLGFYDELAGFALVWLTFLGAVLALHLVLAWFGTVLMLRVLGERSITMPIPMGAFYLVLPLFALLTAAMEARRLAALLRQPED